jgi:hypothetical protein
LEAIIEIFDGHGACCERHKLRTLPIIIGREYSCDVIISDLYVSPKHLEVSKSDKGNLVVRDLDSINGSYLENKKRKISVYEIEKNVELRLGHTLIKIIDPNAPIALTLAFDRPGFWSQRIRFTWQHALFSFIFFVIAFFIDGYLLNNRTIENTIYGVVISAVVGSFMAFLPWAAVWSLLGKVNINKPRFYAHISIPLIVSSIYGLVKRGYAYLEFAFAQPTLLAWFGWIFAFIAITFLFYYHLLYSSRMIEKRRWIYSCLASLLLIIISILVDLKNELSFSNELPLAYLVKPPWVRVVAPSSVDSFADKLSDLKNEL